MKRILLIASLIGLFMAVSLDLQARHRRNDTPRHGRSGSSFNLFRNSPNRNRHNSYRRYDNYQGRHVRTGIGFTIFRQAPLLRRHNSYDRYDNYQGRQVAKEIRRNEKRIWKLEKRIDRLDRRGGDYGEMRELEYEIDQLQRRNDFLRNRLY